MKIVKPYVLGICGGSGSGKSYTVGKIIDSFSPGTVSVLDQDSYYKDLSYLSAQERSVANFDHPDSIDFEQLARDLHSLVSGGFAEKPVYDFKTHTRSDSIKTVVTSPIIIVEGLHIFRHPNILNNIDNKVYLDIEMDIRFIRRLKRDVKERGRDIESIINQYLNSVRPMDIQFIQPCITRADTVITNDNYDHKLSELLESLHAYISATRSSYA
jgi:uridine kinase